MRELRRLATDFFRDESGPTATEYAAMVALIAVVIIAGGATLGNAIATEFSDVSTHIEIS